MPDTRGIRYQSLPKSLTLLENRCAAVGTGMAPE